MRIFSAALASNPTSTWSWTIVLCKLGLVGFDAKAAEKIRNAWNQVLVKERVRRLACVGIVLLSLLAITWAYLRLDLSTAGRYRWRLRLAAATALVAVVFFGLRLS